MVARLPKETSKTKDITGGLPRVAELFEARRPKDSAIIAENDGSIEFGKELRGKQKISIVKVDGTSSSYLIPKGKHINFNQGEKIKKGDSVYVIADTNDLNKVMGFFGHQEAKANSVIIVGGGNIGVSLAKRLEESKFGANIKLIELKKERAENISVELNDTLVINGSSLDLEILKEAKISETETIISVTNQDEVNILTSLLAKKQGCKKAISLANDTTYRPILEPLGIDDVLSPQAITVSRILSFIRKGSIKRKFLER